MIVFVSPLTFYTYERKESREELNREESSKFLEGMRNAGKYDRMLIFSPYSQDEFSDLLKKSTTEGKWFEDVLAVIESSDAKWVKTDLFNYQRTYEKVYGIIWDLVCKWEEGADSNLEIYMNLSCGHKIGSLAIYMAVLNIMHGDYYGYLSGKKGRRIRIRPYHSERGIVEELPVMNFKNEKINGYEKYLAFLQSPLKIEEFKRLVQEEDPLVKNLGDKVIMYLKKRGYIRAYDGKMAITPKGRTFYDVLRKLGEI